MAACSPATSRPMVVVRPVSQPSSSRAIPRAAPVERRQPGEWAMARGANPNVTLPHRVAPLQHRHISWEACRSAHRLPVSERLDAPKVSQGALESGPETVKKWTRLADQRGLLDARAICFQTSPPSGADSVGRSPETQFRHVHASAASHPVDVDPAAPRLPQITGSQSSCQLKSPHHHRPLIVQCVPVSQCGWQRVASWGKRRTPTRGLEGHFSRQFV